MKYLISAILASIFIYVENQASSHSILMNISPVEIVVESAQDSAYNAFMESIPPFTFNTFEIEQHEGCTDSLVYPGGASGPTISCGLDLGNAGIKTVNEVLKWTVSDSVYQILIKATRIKGEASIGWIRKNQVHIGKKLAMQICTKVKKTYWRYAVARYPNLDNAPSEVKTAMLDITMQAGIGSKRLDGFASAISRSDWNAVGVLIENSYSDFEGGSYNSIHMRRVHHGLRIQYAQNPPNNLVDYD